MNWRDHIFSDSNILRGKPVVRGTRLSVEFLLGLLGAGWTESELLKEYPTLDGKALQAIYLFAAELAREEGVYAISLV